MMTSVMNVVSIKDVANPRRDTCIWWSFCLRVLCGFIRVERRIRMVGRAREYTKSMGTGTRSVSACGKCRVRSSRLNMRWKGAIRSTARIARARRRRESQSGA